MTERARSLLFAPGATPHEQWEALLKEYGLSDQAIDRAMTIGPDGITEFIEAGPGANAEVIIEDLMNGVRRVVEDSGPTEGLQQES
jgi:hypothetical protein